LGRSRRRAGLDEQVEFDKLEAQALAEASPSVTRAKEDSTRAGVEGRAPRARRIVL